MLVKKTMLFIASISVMSVMLFSNIKADAISNSSYFNTISVSCSGTGCIVSHFGTNGGDTMFLDDPNAIVGATQLGNQSAINYAFGLEGDDVIVGSSRGDKIMGNQGRDTIFGISGENQIHGGRGVATIVGGDMNDIIYTDLDGGFVWGGAGNDEIYVVPRRNDNDPFYPYSYVDAGTGNNKIIVESRGVRNGDVVVINNTSSTPDKILLDSAYTITAANISESSSVRYARLDLNLNGATVYVFILGDNQINSMNSNIHMGTLTEQNNPIPFNPNTALLLEMPAVYSSRNREQQEISAIINNGYSHLGGGSNTGSGSNTSTSTNTTNVSVTLNASDRNGYSTTGQQTGGNPVTTATIDAIEEVLGAGLPTITAPSVPSPTNIPSTIAT